MKDETKVKLTFWLIPAFFIGFAVLLVLNDLFNWGL